MKGDISTEVFAAVIIAIVVLAWGVDFILSSRIDVGDGTQEDYVECEYNSDCLSKELCLSINGDDYFCGCLEDSDCLSGSCIGNECRTSN